MRIETSHFNIPVNDPNFQGRFSNVIPLSAQIMSIAAGKDGSPMVSICYEQGSVVGERIFAFIPTGVVVEERGMKLVYRASFLVFHLFELFPEEGKLII